MIYLVIMCIAYLLGSINTSIIVGRLMSGEDIRNHGSGNAGATNTLRTFGKGAAILVLLGDALKAVIALLIAKYIFKNIDNAVYVAGIGVTLGHNFPVFFRFKGGKGIVVSTVAILFADWQIGLIAIFIALTIMATSKYVSLGSIIGAVSIIVLGIILRGFNDTSYIIFSVILGGLAIIMHRKNIVRLIKGTENKLGASKKKGDDSNGEN